MDCSQILPGAVNLGPCSAATGYLNELPFICYASGSNLILLDGRLKHVQTILGSDFGFSHSSVTCMHVAESNGQVAAAWDCDVLIFVPEKSDQAIATGEFGWSWKLSYSHSFSTKVLSLSFNQDGSQLLVGGNFISLWTSTRKQDSPPTPRGGGGEGTPSPTKQRGIGSPVDEGDGRGHIDASATWNESWTVTVASPIIHLKFSPDGSLFASASLNDRLVKIWYKLQPRRNKVLIYTRERSLTDPHVSSKEYSFTYIAHPRAITGFVWRKTSIYMKQSSVSNVLLTRCKDNICRLWSQTLPKEKAPQSNLLRFFLAASIDPVADIPFRSTMPVEDADFIVHWLNNKEMTYSSKAHHIQQSAQMVSRNQSMTSLASSPNEEMLASWVCVEEKTTDTETDDDQAASKYQSFTLGEYLGVPGGGGGGRTPVLLEDVPELSKKHENQLMDEWVNSPDLLVCIHPNNGSLMVWTVEGLDSPRFSTRLVHISFSSCLPHVFPPHLAQTLHQELQQYLLKEPEPIGLLSAPLSPTTGTISPDQFSTTNASELSLPVPQIRLPSGQKVVDIPESAKTFRPESSLILLSTHRNGNVNAWSVELTVQANYCTSISGLIHCGQTGGHSQNVSAVYRHPWLPVLLTVAASQNTSERGEEETNELIIWNTNPAGPLDHKAQINELSKVLSTDPNSFTLVSWVPPISLPSSSVGALSRCPSFGLFVTNVGNELCLFQTSLYPIILANSSHTLYHTSFPLYDSSNKMISLTSHSGNEGMSFISLIDPDLDRYQEIVSLHAFRTKSAIIDAKAQDNATEHDPESSEIKSHDFSNEVLVVLIENQKGPSSPELITSLIHVWRIVLKERKFSSTQKPSSSSYDPWYQTLPRSSTLCQAQVTKVLSGVPFPLGGGDGVSHIIRSRAASDVASSLQLQLPSLSSPFLFLTVSSSSDLNCWQFKVSLNDTSDRPDEQSFTVQLYDVFGADSPGKLCCSTHSTFEDFSLSSPLPLSLSCAYPGRFAMAHYLAEQPLSLTSETYNPLTQHVLVSIWECESSGGLQWNCESQLPLHGIFSAPPTFSPGSRVRTRPEVVNLDWLPMENGSYLLATCFSSIITIFGMSLTKPHQELKPSLIPFLSSGKETEITIHEKTCSSWISLLQFSLSSSLLPQWMAYTGSNSILIGIGSGIEIYTCWIKSDNVGVASSDGRGLSTTGMRVLREGTLEPGVSDGEVSLLDYAHSENSPLPQYHPQILSDLMTSGKLDAVKLILINLVKHLLLYQRIEKKERTGYFEEEEEEERENTDSRGRLLSVVDGKMRRSRKARVMVAAETIAPLSLSQLKIFASTDLMSESKVGVADDDDEVGGDNGINEDDDYDALFSHDIALDYDSEFTLSDSASAHMEYDKIDIASTEFTQELADKLASILQYTSLPDISDLDQVRLIAIADTVATTKGGCLSAGSEDLIGGADLGTTAGAGYASVGGVSGGIGGDSMDDCGMRYLLALQNYLTLSHTLPKGLAPLELSTCDLIWAFHSDAELELLSNVPCVRENRLNWPELMSAGVSVWVRSNDTLRKLAEKLAKAQFMSRQDPLDASLLYLAMKKQSLIKGLYRTVSDERMRSFFSNDFTQDRWRRAALKNAFALLSKQRFDHAAAFFLLAGKLWDAIDVCVNRLHDIKLAIMIARLYEGENGSCYHRLLKEHILGETTPDTNTSVEMSPDPFLRSIAYWLLQDFSSSLETLLTNTSSQTRLEPAIFNFYFYLRSHPLLLRSRYPLSNTSGTQTTSKSSLRKKPSLTGVGDDPLTAAERNLVFSTAYHHLSNGSPLLSLIVLNKLPKGSDLGLHDNKARFAKSDTGSLTPTGGTSAVLDESVFSSTTIGHNVSIASGLLGGEGGGAGDDEVDWSQPVSLQKKAEEDDDFDWSRPVASQTAPADDDFDWSKPVSAQAEEEEEFDWSKPAMSQHRFSLLDDIELTKEFKAEEIKEEEEEEEEEEGVAGGGASNVISCQGLFILSLAEQLQYNALLSILTEELKTIHIPACCNHLWKTRGKEALPLLPLGCQASRRGQSMVEWFEEEPLERVLSTLQGRLVNWLRSESMIVSEVCGLEIGAGSSSVADSKSAAHAGYDLLTTLMNYVSLHSSTLPHLLSVQTELMHLMNTLLPWSTGLSHELEDTDLELGQIPSCAINPAQLPLLTSCSLPSKHPLNLALHIRLLSASVFGSLSLHSTPPISSNPLPNLDHIFELCCSLSHCLYLCLNPMRLQQDKQSESLHSPGTPKTRKRLNSGGILLDVFLNLDKPNTKPSRWPGLDEWPSSLLSDDGKEASPLCLVLMEALTVVYTGLLSVAWSNHSIYDILVLAANVPTQAKWAELFGGGVLTKIPDQKKTASFVRKVASMKNLLRQAGRGGGHEAIGLFVAPKKSLLFHCLTKPDVPTSSAFHFEKEPVAEHEDSSDEEGDDDVYDGGLSSEGDGAEEQDACNPIDPNCYSWCVMNLGIVQMLQRVLRNTITLTGMEILEFITASPVLYRLLSLLDDWESFFIRKLDTHSTPSLNLFLPTENNQETRYGPALTRHKLILEPEHSPFRKDDRNSKLARRLWCYLVHQEPIRDTFIRYIFYKKRIGSATPDEPPVQRILYRQPDSPVSCLCISSSNASVFALATSKEVLEVEVPDIESLDIMMDVDDNNTDSPQSRKRPEKSEDFIMIPSGPSSFMRRVGNYTPGHVTYSQSGCTSSILLRRSVPLVKKMSAHPTLAYYLTGGADGAVKMFEFGTPKPVSVLRAAGSGPGITQIRFTRQGNKYGITDANGKLSLWQGIQGNNKHPYQTLHPANTHQTIADFAFLGSSSLIATCGESPNHKNMCIWDTMMPSRSNIVHEWVCHEGGASAIVFSRKKQTLISGGKRGEICIYDVRSKAVVSKPVVHSAAVSCIVINDSDGYFITGSADGEIKVWDLSTVAELTSIQGKHTRARLFRADEGVMDMMVDSSGCLYSCGADGTVKVHSLDLPSI
ncbi:PREDICTED: dmX-like protein 2 isoform X3 [Amphimedon queenslandica]|uniref:RAVE complex protein Rav1 C-terminal domain-containing protein n=1 Tax=Amphimedon queenslandica TaxID=400682 RepID=A0A1X7VDJ1_AMPQE|nr:PREDICTED: dmX-like protein 2 isoform X2 [Amphimedon queenslandica]XP_019849575.1 PREDICTED: dmX-like protein 2 isoform X3 [Amphimedon queenslandica]|eukprot:XP_019849574.1 PREDICTED: dmX-like protein 2 isoform X2 [Amphimedon queenslandica]